IKDSDKNTKEKANGRYRLLLVDGHNSHYTRAFLQYARIYKIIVLCYPAHTTHLLQGLDIVVFAILKHWLSWERDRWEKETGESVSKSNFLIIYGRAHLRALTPEIIKTAFCKTGIWPFSRDVISKADMAPSKETSCEAHLPI
ncbi:DDE-domain-containing protein, partial [Athelia psychrophila]